MEIEEKYSPVGYKILHVLSDGRLRSPIMGTIWNSKIMEADCSDETDMLYQEKGIHAIRLPKHQLKELPSTENRFRVLTKVKPIVNSKVVISKYAFRASRVKLLEIILHPHTPREIEKAVRNVWERQKVKVDIGIPNSNHIDDAGRLYVQKKYFGSDLYVVRETDGTVFVRERDLITSEKPVDVDVYPGTPFHKSLVGYLPCTLYESPLLDYLLLRNVLATRQTEGGDLFFMVGKDIESEDNPIILYRRLNMVSMVRRGYKKGLVICKAKPVSAAKLNYFEMSCEKAEITEIIINSSVFGKFENPSEFKNHWESKGVKVIVENKNE
ncbi:MAG: hypothetical protein QXG97_07335 [Nitrososphaerota archaeon]